MAVGWTNHARGNQSIDTKTPAIVMESTDQKYQHYPANRVPSKLDAYDFLAHTIWQRCVPRALGCGLRWTGTRWRWNFEWKRKANVKANSACVLTVTFVDPVENDFDIAGLVRWVLYLHAFIIMAWSLLRCMISCQMCHSYELLTILQSNFKKLNVETKIVDF